jgi:hypothetical protein
MMIMVKKLSCAIVVVLTMFSLSGGYFQHDGVFRVLCGANVQTVARQLVAAGLYAVFVHGRVVSFSGQRHHHSLRFVLFAWRKHFVKK